MHFRTTAWDALWLVINMLIAVAMYCTGLRTRAVWLRWLAYGFTVIFVGLVAFMLVRYLVIAVRLVAQFL